MVVLGLLLDWEKAAPEVQRHQGLASWDHHSSGYAVSLSCFSV